MKTKYIFVTGGVVSSLGKGIASASIGFLLQKAGYEVIIKKLDPYLNVDPGTMSPFQHGEVFVTDDGAETDLDLGHYERFLGKPLNKSCNTTAGQIYDTIINNERKGKYLGKTVQVIPHVTDEIKNRIKDIDNKTEIVIVEIGGTVGDIEGLPFLEAVRQFKLEYGRRNCFCIHLILIPYIKTAGESKTKPTQHSVIKLREIGIQPNMLICRSEKLLTKSMIAKISLFTNVPESNVIIGLDTNCIYEIPLLYEKQNITKIIASHFRLKYKKSSFPQLIKFVHKAKYVRKTINIAVCGKYVRHHDAYKSIIESLEHAGIYYSCKVNVIFISSDRIKKIDIDKDEIFKEEFKNIHGIIVPGGFGVRGISGKILVVKYAREQNIPFLGICLGMQCAVIEFARNVLGYKNANSTEFNKKTSYPVIDLMEDQKKVTNKGGTMRLGAYPCKIIKNTKTYTIYRKEYISERHRHRYEFNNKYRDIFKKKGVVFSGIYLKKNLVEIVELPDRRFFIATQFHPEFKSIPFTPHPIFKEFVKSALKYKEELYNANQ